jgi:hypothetical protein
MAVLTAKNNPLIKNYQMKRAVVTAKGNIINPQTSQFSPFIFECVLDSGFDGGICAPMWLLSDLKTIGVEPRPSVFTLANGKPTTAYVCAAFITEIDSLQLPPPGKLVKFVIMGYREGKRLMGMDVLKHCKTILDGPKQKLEMQF